MWFLSVISITAALSAMSCGIGLNFHRSLLSPAIGLAVIVIVVSFVGFFGSFSFTISWLLFVFFVLLAIRGARDEPGTVSISIGFSVGTVLGTWGAALLRGAYSATNDTISYLIHSQWLQDHAWSEKVTSSPYIFPALDQVSTYQIAANVGRMGQSFLLAWIQSFSGFEWSYSAFPIAAALPVIGGALAVAYLCGSRAVGLSFAAFVATSLNGLTAGTYIGFYPQALGLCFLLAILGAFPAAPVASSIVLAGIVFCYPEILPFVLATCAGVALLQSISRRDLRPLFRFVAVVALGIALSSFTIRYMLLGMDRAIKAFAGPVPIAIGWPVPFSLVDYLAQSLGVTSSYDGPPVLPGWLEPGAILALLGLGAYGVMRGGSVVLPHVLFLGCMIVMFLKNRYFTVGTNPMEVGNSYLQWKVALWSSGAMLTLVGVGAAHVAAWRTAYRNVIVFSMTMLALLCVLAQWNKQDSAIPLERFLEIRARLDGVKGPIRFEDVPPGFFGSVPFNMAYFLMDRELVGPWFVDKSLEAKMSQQSARTVVFDQNRILVRESPISSNDANPAKALSAQQWRQRGGN